MPKTPKYIPKWRPLNKEKPMTEHTPGPWTQDKVKSKSNVIQIAIFDSSGHNTIAKICAEYGQDEKLIPNARLIEAAPDLLEAAEEVVKNYPMTVTLARAVKAAREGKNVEMRFSFPWHEWVYLFTAIEQVQRSVGNKNGWILEEIRTNLKAAFDKYGIKYQGHLITETNEAEDG